MSTAEKTYLKTQALPESAQTAVLNVVEELAAKYPPAPPEPLTLKEAAELRGRRAAWESDWEVPGMEAYDQP